MLKKMCHRFRLVSVFVNGTTRGTMSYEVLDFLAFNDFILKKNQKFLNHLQLQRFEFVLNDNMLI